MISVCQLLRSGVAAIFGPQSAHTASHVQSICDTMEIPHLETRWDYRLRRQSCLVNLYPHPTTLSKVRTPNNTLIRPSEILDEKSILPFSTFLVELSREKRGRVLIRVSQIALIPRVLASRFCFESCSMSSLCSVYNFLFYDYSYLRIVLEFAKLSGSSKMGRKETRRERKNF